MSFDADTGSGPPANAGDLHSVAESILAKLEASPDPEETGEGETPDRAIGESAGDQRRSDESNDADDADAVAEAVAEFTGKPLYEVVVDGRAERVTLDELRKGYSRQRDYTRKTAALADQRRAIATERGRLKEVLDAFIHDAEIADPVLAEGRATDWRKLAVEQPEAYAQRRAEFDRRVARLHEARSLRQQAETEDRAAQAGAFQAFTDRERAALLRHMPELADPARRAAMAQELGSYAAELGFAKDEQALIVDHRMLRVFKDAASYAKLRRSKDAVAGKRVAAVSRTQSPRASRDGAAGKSERLNALKRNALRTGRFDDMVESILAHLEED